MGLSRDRRAPVELSDEQKNEVRNDPLLVALRDERETYKSKLREQGIHRLTNAKGTPLYAKYEEANRKVNSVSEKLRRVRLTEAIRTFHDSIDTIEIAKQLSGKAATEVLTLPTIEFELQERASTANMLFKPFESDRARVRFISTLARLCHLQETRNPKALKRKMDFIEDCVSSSLPKHKKNIDSSSTKPIGPGSSFVKYELPTPDEEVVEIHQYPKKLPHPVCLLCLGNKEFSYERRMRHIPRKDVLKKHIKSHFKDLEYQGEFECRHPACSVWLDGMEHFMRHALDEHGAFH
jgi:hypothetical protein